MKTEAIDKVVQIDEAELCLIVVEAMSGRQRPEGMKAAEALDDLNLPPEFRAQLHECAHRTIVYIVECMNAGGIEAHEPRLKGARLDA
jgi:hypothetical protein